MVNVSSSQTKAAVRQGALGLALVVPLLATTPVRAQDEGSAPTDATEITPAAQPRVLVSEVVIEGIAGHPEQERLELAAYEAMAVRPGSRVTRDQLKLDLDAIYATGWFADVGIDPVDGPLGVKLAVQVVPNPVFTKVELEPEDAQPPASVIADTFSADYGRTLNFNVLQQRMKELQGWYSNEGYSLARLSGPSKVSPEGVVRLKVVIGTVAGVEVQFLNKDGDPTDDKGQPIKGKTRPWVVTREISIKPGQPFNRTQLEADLRRLYSTSLFSDVKVTLKPVAGEPGRAKIVLGIVEQSTGSLSGGLGYSQSQGVFGQVQLADTNLLGRAWNVAVNLNYGQFGGLANLTFTDPWIKGDQHRTSFRTSLFLSREVPQVFQSQNNGSIVTLRDYADNGGASAFSISNPPTSFSTGSFDSVSQADDAFPNTSWFDFEGETVALQRVGGNIIFARPLNGGDPFKAVPWNVVTGLSIQNVRPINFNGDSRAFAAPNNRINNDRIANDEVVCVAFNCATENNLVGLRFAATYSNLNDSRNPTSGNFFSVGTEQFVSVGENSPTFNRVRTSYNHFIPVNWLRTAKGCRPKPGEQANCPQTIGIQLKAGTVVGQLPPYEAFCLGGSNSVRGWSDCDLAVGRSFGEATIEYRFPIISVFAGEIFADAGTDFGSQANVPGRPGQLLEKPGSGFSVGTGVIVTTPVGPLRLEAASKDFTNDWRFNLGVGWKF